MSYAFRTIHAVSDFFVSVHMMPSLAILTNNMCIFHNDFEQSVFALSAQEMPHKGFSGCFWPFCVLFQVRFDVKA
jgi:hypothetical protein